MEHKKVISVGIIVVTYNRIACLRKCIDAIKKQTYVNYQIYVVDNASNDGTRDWCERCSNINYIRLAENNGGSYGFYYGIKNAVADSSDFIWGMDDDAYPGPDALQNLLEAACIYDINTTAFWSNSHSHLDTYEKGKLEPVRSWTFVGFALSKKIIESIGYPRNDLFIFCDDTEYAQRIIDNGYAIVKVHDSIIIHEGALNKNNKKSYHHKKFLAWDISFQMLPEWKIYYLVRNRILIARTLKQKLTAFGYDLKLLGEILYVCPEMLPVWIKGFADGLKGKSGKVIMPI